MRISKEIKAEYEQKRRRAMTERDKRTRAAYALSPRLQEIAEERQQAIFSLGRERITEGGDTLPYAAKLEALEKEQTALLTALGLPQDVFEPHFACALCGDTGFTGDTVKTPCACMKQRVMLESFNNANLRGNERFDAFREDIYPNEKQRKGTMLVRNACEAYAEDFPCGGKGILLYGESGLGKSFLLNCIVHRVLQRGYSAVNQTAYKLMDDVMFHIQTRTSGEDYTEPDLLVIDDLGTEPAFGDITVNTLFSILNERQSLKRPTLFASNLSPSLILDRYGERLYSRIVSPRMSAVYELKGADLRLVRA